MSRHFAVRGMLGVRVGIRIMLELRILKIQEVMFVSGGRVVRVELKGGSRRLLGGVMVVVLVVLLVMGLLGLEIMFVRWMMIVVLRLSVFWIRGIIRVMLI